MMKDRQEPARQAERRQDEADRLPCRCVRESGCHYRDACAVRGYCRLADTE